MLMLLRTRQSKRSIFDSRDRNFLFLCIHLIQYFSYCPFLCSVETNLKDLFFVENLVQPDFFIYLWCRWFARSVSASTEKKKKLLVFRNLEKRNGSGRVKEKQIKRWEKLIRLLHHRWLLRRLRCLLGRRGVLLGLQLSNSTSFSIVSSPTPLGVSLSLSLSSFWVSIFFWNPAGKSLLSLCLSYGVGLKVQAFGTAFYLVY